MKIVIVGAGRAGLEVATHLTRIGHAITIVDNDQTVTRRASEQYGLMALTGDATIAAVLEEADIARSDVVVAMLRRDADNLAVALLARAAGVGRVMVRMRDNAYGPVYAAAGIEPEKAAASILRAPKEPLPVDGDSVGVSRVGRRFREEFRLADPSALRIERIGPEFPARRIAEKERAAVRAESRSVANDEAGIDDMRRPIRIDPIEHAARRRFGQIVLGDEFSPDGCRLWDKETRKKMDKDRFRQGLGDVIEAYEEVAKRLGVPL